MTRPPAVSPAYREWLKRECTSVDLEFRRREGHAVRLNNIYVPLTALTRTPAGLGDDRTDERALAREEHRPRLLLDLLGEQSLYISGAAGTGKSTFCRWVAWLACEGTMPVQDVEAPEEYVERVPEALRGRLPLLVRARDFWSHLPATPGRREMFVAELEGAIEKWIAATKPGGLDWDTVQAHMASGSALLIVDGVDEVPLVRGEGLHVSSPRELLLSALGAAIPDWTARGNRVVLTSRPYGVSEPESAKLGILDAPIAELDDIAQLLLARRWFYFLEVDPAKAEDTAREMIEDVRGIEGLEPLMANPLLLTAICVVYGEGGRLPQDQYDLYNRIVENVLYNRYPRDPALIGLVRFRLNAIAYGMNTGIGLGESWPTPRTTVTRSEIARLIAAPRGQNLITEAGFKEAEEAGNELLSRSGLLLPTSGVDAAFYHLSFQDFFAAHRLHTCEIDELVAEFESRARFAQWRATLTFLFGAILGLSGAPGRAIRLLEKLIERLTPESIGLQVAVSACLDIFIGRWKIGLPLLEGLPQLEDRFRTVCLASIESEVQPVSDRAALARTLGKIGDPRIVIDLRDPAAYVDVPAGDHLVGDEKRPFRLDKPFRLSRYPVVNAQYALFIEEGGYDNRDWWSEDGRRWLEASNVREPGYWRNGRWNGSNQPVVGVSFWEAEAFAKWAGGRLPTEWEWEAAARGPEGFEYPWGDKWIDGICNTDEAGLRVTSPVGIFPRSRSKAFGLDDMAGNVWEWCSDFYDEKEIFRVVRGGSWLGYSGVARAAVRYYFHPEVRFNFVGFRVGGGVA